MIYSLYSEPIDSVMATLADSFRRRRLEKGLSRKAVSEQSGVPTPTIARFETSHKISLESYAALCKALGYLQNLKDVTSEPKYSTISELEQINSNRHRQRGSSKRNRQI